MASFSQKASHDLRETICLMDLGFLSSSGRELRRAPANHPRAAGHGHTSGRPGLGQDLQSYSWHADEQTEGSTDGRRWPTMEGGGGSGGGSQRSPFVHPASITSQPPRGDCVHPVRCPRGDLSPPVGQWHGLRAGACLLLRNT